jgi:hypothetical protein
VERTVTTAETEGGAVVWVAEAIVVATPAAVVGASVEVGAASAGAEMSQTDCPDEGPRFGNNV